MPNRIKSRIVSLFSLLQLLGLACAATLAWSAPAVPGQWSDIVEQARGQTVYFHAWGGDARINEHIQWVAALAAQGYDISLRQVKLADTAEAVSRIRSEQAAGRDSGGAVDLLWINGENFAALRRDDLLYGPWTADLPNWATLDLAHDPGMLIDATLPTDGYELPWTRSELNFYYDSATTAQAPANLDALLLWARAHPGRFTYPQPPDFLGTSFLKLLLLSLVADPAVLMLAPDPAQVETISAPLWRYLDELTPMLWRSGRAYPGSGPHLRQLLADGEIQLGLSISPGEVAMAITNLELPETVRAYLLKEGTLSNTSYLGIPYNASAPAAAMVVSNLLLSAQVQMRQQNPRFWGSPSVLDPALVPVQEAEQVPPMQSLKGEQVQYFQEPHPLWTGYLEQQWQQRYGVVR